MTASELGYDVVPKLGGSRGLKSNLAVIALIVTLGIIVKIIHRIFFGPLKSVPGPWYSRVTNLILKYHTLAGSRMYYIHNLHKRYGDAVLIAPDEVDFSSRASHKEINRIGGGYTKARFYPRIRGEQMPDMFALLDVKEHARRRSWYARPLSQAALAKAWEPYIKSTSQYCVKRIKQEFVNEGRNDIFKWWTLLTCEVTAKVAFGDEWNLLRTGELNDFLEANRKVAIVGVFRHELPWLYWPLKKSPLAKIIPWVKECMTAPDRLWRYARRAALNARSEDLATTNVFKTVLAGHEKGNEQITDDVISVEAEGLLAAGAGTVAVTLTYLVWAVLSRPDLQFQLEAEVAALTDDYTAMDLEKLPVLNAVVWETLRVYSAASGTLPRAVPPAGTTLQGHYLPPCTVVTTQAYTMHRDTSVFPKGDVFDPSAWIADPQLLKTQRASLATFGAGTRACVGVHLAQIELGHATAAFFRECRGAKLHADTTEASMHPVDYFATLPAAGCCYVT